MERLSKVQVLINGKGTLEKEVDEDIAAFAQYFCGELKNASLSRPERAILKTYLFYKTRVCVCGEDDNRDPSKSLPHKTWCPLG
jgi:hypothetical protein